MVRDEQVQTELSFVIGEYELGGLQVAFAILDALLAIVEPLMQVEFMTGIETSSTPSVSSGAPQSSSGSR